jgi:hypothetical protein
MKDRTTKHARNAGLRNRTRKPQYSHSPLLPMFVVSPNSQQKQARRAIFYPVLGDSIFSSDGAVWKHSRALLRPYFSRDNINNLAATQSAADALIRIVVSGGKGTGSNEEKEKDDFWTQPTDLLPLFFNFTMDTSTEFLFGEAVGALAAVEREMSQSSSVEAGINATKPNGKGEDTGYGSFAASDEFSEALRIANDGLVMRLRLQNLYWLGDGFAFRRATRRVQGFVDGFVSKALAKVEAEGKKGDGEVGGKSSSNKKYGLLESLLEQTRDREELIAQTLGKMSFLFSIARIN